MVTWALYLLVTGQVKISIAFLVNDLAIFVIIPLLLVFYSIVIKGVSFEQVVKEISPYVITFMFPIIANIGSDQTLTIFKKAIMICASVIIITWFLLVAVNFIFGKEMVTIIHDISRQYELGFIGENVMFSEYFFVPNVYYRWSMWLILAVILSSTRKQYIVSIVATLMTLSTAIIVFSIIGVVIKIVLVNKSNIIKLVSVFVIILVVSLFIPEVRDFLTSLLDKFNQDNVSTSVKIEHIKSILPYIFDENNFLFGQGLGTSFYSTGVNDYVVSIEVSHLNVVRQFGFLYGVIFFTYILVTIFKALKINIDIKVMSIATLMLFLSAGTNPLLISPIFFIPFVILRQSVYHKEQLYNV